MCYNVILIIVVLLCSLHFFRYTELLFQGNDAFTYYNMRYDRIWYRYCFERFSWYADMILIYTYIHIYMYYILPKLYVNMHRFFNTSEYLLSIYICAKRVKQPFAQSTITFGYILSVNIRWLSAYFYWTVFDIYCVPYAKIVKVIRKQRN